MTLCHRLKPPAVYRQNSHNDPIETKAPLRHCFRQVRWARPNQVWYYLNICSWATWRHAGWMVPTAGLAMGRPPEAVFACWWIVISYTQIMDIVLTMVPLRV